MRLVIHPAVLFSFFSAACLLGIILPSDFSRQTDPDGGWSMVILMYGLGTVSFFFGTLLARGKKPVDPLPNWSRMSFDGRRVAVWVAIAATCGLTLSIVNAFFFQYVPLLAYASGLVEISHTALRYEDTSLGQIGGLQLAVEALAAPAIIYSIKWMSGDITRKEKIFLIALVLLAVSLSLLFAKRITLFGFILFLMISMAVYSSRGRRGSAGRMPARKVLSVAFYSFLALFVLYESIGYIRNMRLGAFSGSVDLITSIEEISNYSAYPIYNFQRQCRDAGLGPGDGNVLAPIRYILPYKIFSEAGIQYDVPPPRVEPSSPGGFYEDLHWGYGVWGIVIFCCALGAWMKSMYVGSLRSPVLFLVYSKSVLLLVFMSTFNYFLFLIHFWIPILMIVSFSWFCRLRFDGSSFGAVSAARLPAFSKGS